MLFIYYINKSGSEKLQFFRIFSGIMLLMQPSQKQRGSNGVHQLVAEVAGIFVFLILRSSQSAENG